MEYTSPLLSKSFEYAVDIVNLSRYLQNEKKEYIIAKQILRAGTSIGANSEEGNGAVSGSDFRNKLAVAYKEARETHYWLRLLFAVKLIEDDYYQQLITKCEELCKILYKSIKTSKEKEINNQKIINK